MDHVSTWFQASLIPDRWDVAGVKCRALSVWHVFALGQTGNPYLCGGGCDRDAAASLLAFCSMNHADGKRLYSQPLFRTRIVKRINRKLKRAMWNGIHEAITDYLSACWRTPGHKHVVSDGKGACKSRSCAAPICWCLVEFLSRGDASKIESAWDTPYAVARCLFDAHRDIMGEDDTLESLEEEIRIDAYIAANGEK